MNGRLSVDQAPRSLLIRQTVDDAARTQGSAAQDPKVVDDEEEGEILRPLPSTVTLLMR